MVELDTKSLKLLHALSADGRISNVELARKVGLSPSACLRRVQDLEASGIISGYRAVLNPEKLGRGFIAYVTVGMSDHGRKSQQSFEKAIAKSADVRECHNITGTYEYLLRVEVADLVTYKAFHSKVLGGLPQVNTNKYFSNCQMVVYSNIFILFFMFFIPAANITHIK